MKTGIAAIAITGMMYAGFMSSQARPASPSLGRQQPTQQLEQLLTLARARMQMAALAAQTVPKTAPAPDRNITPPGAQRQAPPQPQKQTPGTRAPQPISPKLSDGVIEGFVYWDTSLIVHKPADSCNGLAVTVGVDNGLSGPFKGFKPLATLTNNFKYVGQVKTFLAGGKVVTYGVCTYGYDHVPVGPELQVQLTVTRGFALNAVPQPSVVGPITIINGQCNMLPSINPTKLADLTAHWGSCQNMAYSVSFALQQALQTLSAGGGRGKLDSNAGSRRRSPGTPGTSLPKAPGPAGMLSASPATQGSTGGSGSQGMLATSSAERQRALGGSGNRDAGLLGDGSAHTPPGGSRALNPQPLPPRTAAKSGSGLPGANVAQATAAVSDYRQPSGTKESSGSPGTPLLKDPGPVGIPGAKNPGPNGIPGARNPGPTGQPAERNPGPQGFASGVRLALPTALTGGAKVVAGKKVTNALAVNSSIIAVFHQQKQVGPLSAGHTMSSGSMPPIGAEPSNARLKAVSTYIPSNLLTAQENAECQQREAQGLAPEVLRIAGKPNGQGVVYSPDPQANPYTIVGCGFSNTTGSVILGFISLDGGVGGGAPVQKRTLNVQTWNDHEIVASVDPNTSGLSDWGVVRLLVVGQKSTESAKGSFYARRQTIQLPSIPLNQISLYQQGSPYFLSPVSNYYGLKGTVAVMRQALPGPVAGQDQFTLQLPPGFVVESTQTDLLVSNTSANVTSEPASVNGNTITVTYPVVSYSSGNTTSYYSIYGLKIWVTGPAGVTP